MFKFVHVYKVTPCFSNRKLVYKTVLYLGNHGTSCTIIPFPTYFWSWTLWTEHHDVKFPPLMCMWKYDRWCIHVNTTFINLLSISKLTQFSMNMCAQSRQKNLCCVLQVHMLYTAETDCCPVSCRLAYTMTASRDFRKCVPNYSFQKQKVLWRSRPCSITFHMSRLWHRIYFFVWLKGSPHVIVHIVCKSCELWGSQRNFSLFWNICNSNTNNSADSTSWKRAHSSTDYKKPLSIQLETVCINGISTSNVGGTSLKKIFILIEEVSWPRTFIRFLWLIVPVVSHLCGSHRYDRKRGHWQPHNNNAVKGT
jgi:hypothetical protein